MNTVMKIFQCTFIFALVIPVLILEFIIKVVWGIVFFILTPVMKQVFKKESYRACRSYGNRYSLKEKENFPIASFVSDLWDDSY